MLRTITLFGFLGFSLIYLTSYSGGPTSRAGDVTGSPLSTQQCSGCHNGGDFGTMTNISLLDQGEEVTAYEAGKTYTLQISVQAINNPGAYGFQAVVLDAANNNAGTFGTPSEDFRVATSNMRDYLEHRRTQSASTVEIDWTAPAAGTGEVSVYAAGNAVNANSGTSGDNVDTNVLTLTENGASSTRGATDMQEFNVYQATAGSVRLELGDQFAFPVQYTIHDISGKVLRAASVNRSEVNVEIARTAPQVVLVVVRDAQGRGGAKRIALR